MVRNYESPAAGPALKVDVLTDLLHKMLRELLQHLDNLQGKNQSVKHFSS